MVHQYRGNGAGLKKLSLKILSCFARDADLVRFSEIDLALRRCHSRRST